MSAAGQMVDGDPGGGGLAPFALDRLAVTRVQRGQKIVKGPVAFIVPVKLLVVALQEAVRPQKLRFRLRGEGYMHGGGVGRVAQRHQAARQRGSDPLAVDAIADQQPWAGGGGEGHRGLQFRIIASAGTLIGIRPAAVEDVFALRMRFQIAGHDAGDLAIEPCQEMPRHPSRCGRRPSRRLRRLRKRRGKRRGYRQACRHRFEIRLRPACRGFRDCSDRLRIGAGVPIRSLDVAGGGDGFEGDFG